MVSGMPSFACSGPNGVTAEVSEALEPRLQQAAAKNLVLAKVEQEARQACVMAKPLITSRGATVVCAQGGLGVFLRRPDAGLRRPRIESSQWEPDIAE